MRTVFAAAAVVVCLDLAAVAADGPSVKVHLVLKGETLHRTADIQHMVLVNDGEKAVEVATANMSVTVRETGETATLILSFWQPSLWQGHRLVESRLRLMPTLLEPGQAVVCQLPVDEIAKALDVLLGAAKDVRVIYKVSEEAGKQFNVWSGAVRSEAYPVAKK